MSSKMLVDAAHPEETRVVVVRGNRVEDFDYESATRKQLRGNIYLAKVTRVEPSLQAAFVDYGGNRHGFLAFNEIHPDYYQIPVADRKALLAEEAAEASRAAAEDDDPEPAAETDGPSEGQAENGGDGAEAGNAAAEASASDDRVTDVPARASKEDVESVGSEDALEELPVRTRRRRRRIYKIQEVIKRRQIILVQVVKEERGNKGAALTTYLSLAGRYTVLMPNTARGGGISRKITNPADRKRLRKIASELEVADGMGLIIRTAGASRTKAEIKRDFEYLLRLWENVRDLTLNSTAPTLVYEEGNLIKRSIRDLYNKDIESIEVAGDEAYKEAKTFMRMLMPSHAKNVQPYKEAEPILVRHKVERQLSAMLSPRVTLRSGGYIIINQTEALVAIDVNSGRATREHSIEDTALKTNLEAADEVARQLRLRDLAGLIVIDFIDMEERRNNRSVERRLKEALRNDRARIQVGRISHFGLLEMSRQRLRTGMLEGTTSVCSMCQGTGMVRSTESVALDVLRTIEDKLISEGATDLVATTSVDTSLYILNQKRDVLKDIEARYGVDILVTADEVLHGANFTIERMEPEADDTGETAHIQLDATLPAAEEAEEDGGKRRQRRRRGRRGGRHAREDGKAAEQAAAGDGGDGAEAGPDGGEAAAAAEIDGAPADKPGGRGRRPRRRGRRGGRRARSARAKAANGGGDAAAARTDTADAKTDAADPAEPESDPAPKAKASGAGSKPADSKKEESAAADTGDGGGARPEEKAGRTAAVIDTPAGSPADKTPPAASGPPRRGWWQRGAPPTS